VTGWILQLKIAAGLAGGSLEAKCLRIGDFLWCFRGEWMRNRGVLHGFCVVILQVEKHANFLNFIFCGDGALGG
jgi:hypothetical protein